MKAFTFITSFLLISSFSLILYLSIRLFVWDRRFRKYSITLANESKSLENDSFIIGKKAPLFSSYSLKKNKQLNIFEAINTNYILIFIDSNCIYCENNIDIFLNEIQRYSSIEFAIVMRKEELKESKKLFDLYKGTVEILLVNEQTYIDYKIQFWPAFILLNSDLTIKEMTPIPPVLLKSLEST